MEIRIACRKSPLAVLQANKFINAIQKKYGKEIKCRLIPMHSAGDLTDKDLSQIGGKGLFVSELESALVSGNADVAIHSLKDVPAKLNDGFEIISCLKRGNPNDVIVLKKMGLAQSKSLMIAQRLQLQVQEEKHNGKYITLLLNLFLLEAI